MRKHFALIFFLSSLVLFISRCAQIVPLSGGQRDITAPKLMEAEPALNSTRFNSEKIVLKFDEFVQLKDLSNQLIVTPQLKTNPELSTDGKKVIIELNKAELKPNTTYRIFIGKAIADMTESNSVENFEYVFTTGEYIDTLQLKGSIIDAFNGNPSAGMSISMYAGESFTDSLPFLEKPEYFTRSNENGEFLLKNLPKGKFRVYGISDLNKNSKYDGSSEKIAFLDADLKLNTDTFIELKLFQEAAGKVFVKKTLAPYTGLFQLLLSKPAIVKLNCLNAKDQGNMIETEVGKLKDTISIFYKNISDTLSLIVGAENKTVNDTLHLVSPKKRSISKSIKNFSLNTVSDKIGYESKLRLTFPVWMDTSFADLSKLKLLSKKDSVPENILLKGKWTGITTFELDSKLREGGEYTLKIDSSAFFDVNHLSNDSAKFKIGVYSKSDFGKVRLNLKLNKKQAYLIQLLNDQNMVSKELPLQFSLSSSNAVSIDFTDVTPGNYRVKIIFDSNENKKWDSGDVILKKLPEEVIINSKVLKVLSDWEIEEEISIH